MQEEQLENHEADFRQGLKYEYAKNYRKALEIYKIAAKNNDERAVKKMRFFHLNKKSIAWMIIFVVIAIVSVIVTKQSWVGLLFSGFTIGAITTTNYKLYWYKIGKAYKINLALLLFAYIFLVPAGAISPYLYGVTWMPVTVLLVLSILITFIGLISFVIDREKMNVIVFGYGVILLVFSLVSFGIDTPDKKFGVVDVDGGVEIISYRSTDVDVTIPTRINNKLVVSIGSEAFAGEPIKTLVVGDNVKYIGSRAFYNTALESVVLPDDITLDTAVFAYNPYLTSINIPSTLIDIPTQLFYGNQSLETITLPSDLRSIGYGAFSYTAISSFNLPDTLVSIGSRAFSNMQNLKSIDIPDSVTYMGSSVFSNDMYLTDVTLPSQITHLPAQTFLGTLSLSHVDLPLGMTSMGDEAFYNSRIETIGNIDLITSYGEGVFRETTHLETITLGNISNIPDYMFYNSRSLTHVYFTSQILTIGDFSFGGVALLESIDLNEGLTQIGNGAFMDCEAITSVAIPESVTYIGEKAFQNCIGLTSFVFPENLSHVSHYVLDGASNLESVTLPLNPTYIGDYAFRETKITSINIPGSVKTIGEGAFYHINTLTSVVLNEGLISISGYAFYDCGSLTTINLPESLESIYDLAFALCDTLEEVTIYSNVTYVGYNVFFRNDALTIYLVMDQIPASWDSSWNSYGVEVVFVN